jgi:hypothetical protein
LWPSRCWRPSRLLSPGLKRPTEPGPWHAALGAPLALRACASARETRECASYGRLTAGKCVSFTKSPRQTNNLVLDDSPARIVKKPLPLPPSVCCPSAATGQVRKPAISTRQAVDNPIGSE